MADYRLAFIGFGNVGQGLAQILAEKTAFFEQSYGATLRIVAVSDLHKGGIYDPEGLSPQALLDAVQAGNPLESVSAPYHGWDALKTITDTNANVIVEMSYTDLQTAEPALTHLKTAFEHGKHVVTTNKGPVALAYTELVALTQMHHVTLGVEGTVMSGTPTIRLGQEMIAPAHITQLQGILNGTTNYMLTQMENGQSYADALADAQAKGYAEANPAGDVEGYDAAAKVVILANLLMGASLRLADVDRTGITALTSEDIATAKANGNRWKLIGRVAREGETLIASVKPTQIPLAHPLASVMGATNALTYTTDLLGQVTVIGAGAGRLETGYALIQDILAIGRSGANL